MKSFNETREEVLKRVEELILNSNLSKWFESCNYEGERQDPFEVKYKEFLENVSSTTNKTELLSLIIADWCWCLMIDTNFIKENFEEDELRKVGIR